MTLGLSALPDSDRPAAPHRLREADGEEVRPESQDPGVGEGLTAHPPPHGQDRSLPGDEEPAPGSEGVGAYSTLKTKWRVL